MLQPNGHETRTKPIWETAPVLVGTTNFEPRKDVCNIMVTGGAGFIASWVLRHLVLKYPSYNIVCFDKMDYCSSANNTAVLGGAANFTTCLGDLTHPPSVVACMEAHRVDTVMHFAAQSHVDLSFGNSYGFTQTNVFGTHVLLESAKKVGVRRFIHVSTDEVYGEVRRGEDDVSEASILAPTNPYAASKAAAEMMVQSYQKSFNLPCIIVRSNNVYGPHQYPEKIIPKFICLLNRGSPVVLHGNGCPTRRYLYAADATDAFDTILHKGQIGQIYNVSSADEVSNLDLCKKLLSVMADHKATCGENTSVKAAMTHQHRQPPDLRKWVKYTHDRPFNDCRYAVDGTKLRELGWKQRVSLDEGLHETFGWYSKFGEAWWGDISHALTPFPVVEKGTIVEDVDHRVRIQDDPMGSDEKSQSETAEQRPDNCL